MPYNNGTLDVTTNNSFVIDPFANTTVNIEGTHDRLLGTDNHQIVNIGTIANDATVTLTGNGSSVTLQDDLPPWIGDSTGPDGALINLVGTNETVAIEPTAVFAPTGNNTVHAYGAGNDTVLGGGGNFVFQGGRGTYLVNAGHASYATINGGAGGGVFMGGYSDYLSADYPYGGFNTIIAGQQASTLVGGMYGTSTLVATGNAPDVLIAGEYGADTLNGGQASGNDLLQGYLGPATGWNGEGPPADLLIAGSGNDTLVAGFAADTLRGGSGHDLFAFQNQPPRDFNAPFRPPITTSTAEIDNFVSGRDKIDLQGFAGNAAQQALATATVSGSNTLLSLPNGEQITMSGYQHLVISDFVVS